MSLYHTQKIGWKVVTKRDSGELTSAIIGVGAGSAWCVTYTVGKPTVGRDGTPVLAFRTRQQAQAFKSRGQPIFKAQLDNPRPQSWIASSHRPSTFRCFWRSTSQDRYGFAPDGTLACDAITLLEPA